MNGPFLDIHHLAYWWSATENDETYAWHRLILSDTNSVSRLSANKRHGWSVRCLKD
jgi:uncharacterized protein (TIGR02145 family)